MRTWDLGFAQVDSVLSAEGGVLYAEWQHTLRCTGGSWARSATASAVVVAGPDGGRRLRVMRHSLRPSEARESVPDLPPCEQAGCFLAVFISCLGASC